MKKILLVLITFLNITSISFASDFADWINFEENLEKVKQIELNAGTAYSLMDNNMMAIYTRSWLTYKNLAINYGYSVDNMLIGTATYEVLSLKDDLGIKIPVIDWIRLDLGLFGGWKRLQALNGTQGNNEWDWGPCATLIRKTF